MKRLRPILWLVFISLALSGVGVVFFGPKSAADMKLATVNGSPIYVKSFQRALLDVQERVNALRPLARAYGMSEDLFLSTFLGATKPEELALDMCERDILVDRVKDQFSIQLDPAWFKAELIKTLPQLTDQSGRVNMDAYHHYLSRMSTTAAEYEENKKHDFTRNFVQRFVQGSSHIPIFLVKESFSREHSEKSFQILKMPISLFMAEAKRETVDAAVLEKFYADHKERYRVPEKHQAMYWKVTSAEYSQKVDVDAATIRNFYDRHKSSLYRVLPKVKVRRILIGSSLEKAKAIADDIHKKAVQHPASFADLAKKHSSHSATAQNGGLVDFFSKGTYSPEFERASFRLVKEGEISPVVKTKDGYEIIQLVQRLAATEKPFDSVKSEIAKTLQAKRIHNSLRAEMENLMRLAAEDPSALEAFAKKHSLKSHQTPWLADHDASSKGIDGALAKRLFSKHRRQSVIGYVPHDDGYVIYKLAQSEKSYIPGLADIKDVVTRDLQAHRADMLAKSSVKEARAALLSKKTTLSDIMHKLGGSLSTSKKMKASQAKSEFEHDGALQQKLFLLTDPAQVLEYKHKDTIYLAQLASDHADGAIISDRDMSKIIKQEKHKQNSMQVAAFIASLRRNAKIVVDQKFFQAGRVDTKD